VPALTTSARLLPPCAEIKKTETTTTKKQRRLAEFDWEQLRRAGL
jgi:hypothetical protein